MGYSPWSSKELDMTEGLSLSWCVEVPKFCITKYVFLPFMVSAVYVLVCQPSPPPQHLCSFLAFLYSHPAFLLFSSLSHQNLAFMRGVR